MKRFIATYITLFVLLLSVCGQTKSTTNSTSSLFDFYSKTITSNIYFSFAQLSDTHLSLDDTTSIEALNRVVEEINSDNNIAFVVLTGDITEYGDYATLSLAKSILSKLNCPYYAIPGNHDTKWSASGGNDFKKVFGDDKFRLLFNGFLFLGIDNAPCLRQTDGHLSPEDKDWLARQLKNVGRKTPVFIFSHYPPKSGDMDNWFELTDLVRTYNTQAILCGHYHRNMMIDFDGIAGMAVRPLIDKDKSVGYAVNQISRDSIYFYEKLLGDTPVFSTQFSLDSKSYIEGDKSKFPRPDYSVNQQNKNIKLRWKTNVGYEINSSPVVSDQSVYFGDNHGIMRSLAVKNGKEIWTYRTGGAIICDPQIVDDKLIFTSTDNSVYCLNKNDGKKIWSFTAKSALVSTPLISQGVVYVGGSDGEFYALNLISGQKYWSFNQVESYIQGQPSIYDGNVIFANANDAVYSVRASDGTMVWKYNSFTKLQKVGYIQKSFTHQSFSSHSSKGLLVAKDKVFFVDNKCNLVALDATNGEMVWTDTKSRYTESFGVSLDNNYIFARSTNGEQICIDLSIEKFNKSTIDNSYSFDNNHSQIVLHNNELYYTTIDGQLIVSQHRLQPNRSQYKIGNAAINTVSFQDDNRLIVTTTDGVVALIEIIKK